MARAVFSRDVPPNWWRIPARSPTEPPQGYEWRRAVEPGPVNGPPYVPKPDEIVFISVWAGRDSYTCYEDAKLTGHQVHYQRMRTFTDQLPPPFLYMVTGFQPVPDTEFAWLDGFRCTPAMRVPQGREHRIWVRMTEVLSLAEAEQRRLLHPMQVGESKQSHDRRR